MPKWVWSFMNWYRMFVAQTFTLPLSMHQKPMNMEGVVSKTITSWPKLLLSYRITLMYFQFAPFVFMNGGISWKGLYGCCIDLHRQSLWRYWWQRWKCLATQTWHICFLLEEHSCTIPALGSHFPNNKLKKSWRDLLSWDILFSSEAIWFFLDNYIKLQKALVSLSYFQLTRVLNLLWCGLAGTYLHLH